MGCKALTYQNFSFLEVVHQKNVTGKKFFRRNGDHLGNVRLTYVDSDGNGTIDTNTEIISEKNYYPFGLEHKGYNDVISANVNSMATKFKYNGIEHEEALGLNLYEMDLRQYDPTIARWTSVDPVVHFDYSPYSAFDNNPIYWADPSGADSESFIMDLFNKSSNGEKWTNNNDGTFSSNEGQVADCDECLEIRRKIDLMQGKLIDINNKLVAAKRFKNLTGELTTGGAAKGLLLEMAIDLKDLSESDLDKIIEKLMNGEGEEAIKQWIESYTTYLRKKGYYPNTINDKELVSKIDALGLISGVKDRIVLITNLASPHVSAVTRSIDLLAKINVERLKYQQKTTMQEKAKLEKSAERIYAKNGFKPPVFKGGFAGGSQGGAGTNGDW